MVKKSKFLSVGLMLDIVEVAVRLEVGCTASQAARHTLSDQCSETLAF